MASLSSHEIIALFVGLAVLLAVARLLGALSSRLGQPAVLGELTAGILLGPTILGTLVPALPAFLYPHEGAVALVEDGVRQMAVVLFLLVAGMEVDLSAVRKRSGTVVGTSLVGMVVPFTLGYLAADSVVPDGGMTFRLFFATALSISALPVIARILMDLGLYRTEVGLTVVGTAVVDDLIGWNIFGVVVSRMHETFQSGLGWTLLWTVGLAVLVLTVGRRGVEQVLRVGPSHGAVVTGVLTFTLLMAALTEFIGIHGLFGAFLMGVAVGNATGLSEEVRASVQTLVLSFLAPLYFGGVALRVNFVSSFDLHLVLVVLVLAVAGKLLGCAIACRASGMAWPLAWAVGFGLNARGAMGIVLATLALQYGLIGPPMFVALVVMAWITSAMSGPAMRRLLGNPSVEGNVPG